MRHVILLVPAVLLAASLPSRHSAAQGLLHKHSRVAGAGLGTMRPLPVQASSVAIAATGDVSSSEGAAAAVTAVVPLPTGVPGAMPICVMPPAPFDGAPLDAVPMPMPSIDGGPMVVCPGVTPGFEPGSTVSVGGWPDASGPGAVPGPGGPGSGPPRMHHPIHGPLMFGTARGDGSRGHATAMVANDFGQATAATAQAGKTAAAGLPGRAVGVRPATLDVPGRRHMAPIRSTMPGSSAATPSAGVRQDAGVIQAAGASPKQEGVAHAVGAALQTTPASAAAAAPPRWRDRLRLAWPTTK